MYGLPQAGIIAQDLLAKRLKEHGYSQSKTTPSLWKHEWRLVWFSFVVDNFGVKYIGEEHAQHLLQMVQKYYKCLFEPEGERYCGLTIKWDYPGKKVHIAMPFYLKNALKQFQHPPLIVPQDQPHPHVKNNMGQKFNMQSHTMTPPCSISLGRNLSKRSPAYSCTLRKRWI
jgi:hypothetical protein